MTKLLRSAANVVEVDGAVRAIQGAPADHIAAYEFVVGFEYGDIRIAPFQVQEEILALLDVLLQAQPRRVIEIGTAQGGTLFLLTRVAADDAVLVSVDAPGGAFGGGYRRTNGRLYRSFARARQRIHLIRADSHTQETKARVADALGAPVDFLFIDGDHTYDGVTQDFELYEPLVAPDGIIAFHDIVDGPADAVGGVPRFWGEIRDLYDSNEFIHDRTQGGFGIGLIRKSSYAGRGSPAPPQRSRT